MKRSKAISLSSVVKVSGTMYGMKNYNRLSSVMSEEKWEKIKAKHNKKVMKNG